jgi:hypothetical protein
MTFFWGRKVVVQLGENDNVNNAIEINSEDNSAFRVDFNITKNRASTPNKGTIDIYNLPPSIRKSSIKEYDRLTLQAGYKAEDDSDDGSLFGIIIDGTITEITHSRQGTDIVSRFVCVDGGEGYVNGAVNMTYRAGTTYIEIIKDIVKNMDGISVGNITSVPSSVKIPRDRVFFGTGKSSIDTLCRNINCRATVENGLLNIVSNDGGLRGDRNIPKISKDSGMIGSPSVTEKGISVTCLLNPNISPNTFVDVIDETLSFRKSKNSSVDNDENISNTEQDKKTEVSYEATGVYRVNSVVFQGSTFGNQFSCRIEGQKSDGYKVIRPKTLDRDSTALLIET